MKNRIISFVLIISMLFLTTAFASCGSKEDNKDKNDNAQSTSGNANPEDTTADPNLRENAKDNIPADVNFNQEEIRILHRSELSWGLEIAVEGEIGEVLNDEIYYRNRAVEERLNVKIKNIPMLGVWDNTNKFLDYVRKTVNAGTDDFDLVAGYAYFITPLATDGLFLNWRDIKYVEPSQPWWSADFQKEMTINDKMYFVAGDLSLTMLMSMFMVYFNKKLAADFSIENPYKIVLDGDWTLEKLSEMSKAVYNDINGDGKQDDGDLYGCTTTTGNQIDAFFNSFKYPITTKDAEGIPQLSLNSSKMTEMVNKTYSFLYENQGVKAFTESTKTEEQVIQMFVDNKALFLMSTLSNSEKLRAMDSDYGIIPYPKWDKAQDGYYTAAQDAYSLFSVPITCTNTDRVGAVTEALCAESYRKVTPAYYEVTLKKKYSRDDETSQMLDIIRNGLSFNFGTVHSVSMEGMGHIYRDLMTNKKTDFASQYEKNEAKYQKALTKLIDKYQALN